MKYNIIISENFEKEFKPLYKKYKSLKADVLKVQDNIEKELLIATDLGSGFKKIRVTVTSKNKGSSGGARLITHDAIVAVDKTNVVFGSIYSKGQYKTIDIKILKEILGL